MSTWGRILDSDREYTSRLSGTAKSSLIKPKYTLREGVHGGASSLVDFGLGSLMDGV